jgi:hypothetical protein
VMKKYTKTSLWWHKITHWEYWPLQVVYIPVFIYWAYLAMRARSLVFFTASNPNIETGGMLGERKYSILNSIPEKYRTPSVLIPSPHRVEEVLNHLRSLNWSYPLIFKPDIGERGVRVEKINHEEEAKDYVSKAPYDFLVQPFIDYPIELGVFYYRYPSQEKGTVISIVSKEFLSVQGDGIHTLQELIESNPRAAMQRDRLNIKFKNQWHVVLPKGDRMLLEAIGNHCRGTSFQNANHLIDETLIETFDRIAKQIDGFYFGRFDLKCRSIEEMKRGEGIQIVELNGAGSEQGHIYHPGFPYLTAMKTILKQWRVLYDISVENHQRGVAYMSTSEAYAFAKKSKKIRNQYAA